MDCYLFIYDYPIKIVLFTYLQTLEIKLLKEQSVILEKEKSDLERLLVNEANLMCGEAKVRIK